MTKLRELYYCEKCHNLVQITNEGAPALFCCGVKMNKLEAKTEDASTEKHVPFIEEKDGGILVKVGQNAAHPMEDKHHIKFIQVLTADKVCHAELNPGDAPEAWFPVQKANVVKTREWCNVHGLWES
ncbi:DNA topoisomerase II [bacterium]|nr:DNA topoisomerase II [bacterium]